LFVVGLVCLWLGIVSGESGHGGHFVFSQSTSLSPTFWCADRGGRIETLGISMIDADDKANLNDHEKLFAERLAPKLLALATDEWKAAGGTTPGIRPRAIAEALRIALAGATETPKRGARKPSRP
jgi:hypothetical protein